MSHRGGNTVSEEQSAQVGPPARPRSARDVTPPGRRRNPGDADARVTDVSAGVDTDIEDLGRLTAQRQYWAGHVALGFAILAGQSAATVGYLSADRTASHRGPLIAIAVAMTVVGIAGVFVGRLVARQAWRGRFVLVSSVVASVVLDLCASLDGGLDSPLLYMSVLPLIFTGMLLSPMAVAATGVVTTGGVVSVGLLDGGIDAPHESGSMFAAFVVGVMVLMVSAARHRVEMQRSDERLMHYLAERGVTDGLTGCRNQHAFHVFLPREVERAIRYGRPLSLVVCDVDFFKDYNDLYGHDVGDAELARVGADLRSVTRSSDFVARIGGDEFAVLMPETAVDDASAVAARILAVRKARAGRCASLSIGVADLSPREPTAKRLLRDADQAMYDAKLAGRDRVAVRSAARSQSAQPGASPHVAGAERRLLAAVRRSDLQRVEAETVLDAYLQTAPVGFALVDRDLRVVRLNPTLASWAGQPVESQLGRRVPDLVPDLWPALAPLYQRASRDRLPTLNAEVTGRSAATGPATWLITVFPILVETRASTVGFVVVDITDRKRWEKSQADLTDAVVGVLAAAVEARDPYTAGHQKRVSKLAVALAEQLQVGPEDVRGIGLAAAIHDIGKMAVPAELLSRPGPLNEMEMAVVRAHAEAGYDIVKDIHFPWPIADMIRQHHERLDGSGYPFGLRGDEICVGARIIAVADIAEAMTAPRPYRGPLGLTEALREIQRGAGSTLDPAVVDAFVRLPADGAVPGQGGAVA